MADNPKNEAPEVDEQTQHERSTSHHRAKGIEGCPNPACKKGKVVLRGPLDGFFHVRCEGCGLIGPRDVDSLTAIELWNGIYRHGVPYGERCFFLHDWSKWEDHEVNQLGVTVKGREKGIYKGDYLTQLRWCKRCGEKEYRTVRIFDVDKDT